MATRSARRAGGADGSPTSAINPRSANATLTNRASPTSAPMAATNRHEITCRIGGTLLAPPPPTGARGEARTSAGADGEGLDGGGRRPRCPLADLGQHGVVVSQP